MRATILTVHDETRSWDGPNGTIEFISGTFSDDSGWSVGCKPENVAARKAELAALVGVEGDYELEAKNDYQGRKQWKLKSWPGKPVQGSYGGGGKKGKSPEEQDQIARSVALKAAVDWVRPVEGVTIEATLIAAEAFYDFISAGSRPTAQQNPAPDAEGHPGAGSTSPAEKTGEKTGVSGTAGGNTSGGSADGEDAGSPATVGGGSAQPAPAKAGSPSAKRSADAPPPGWEGMWES